MVFDIYFNRPDSRKSIIIAVGIDMPTVVKMTGLDPNEVAWAVEEEGQCEVEEFIIVEGCDDCAENGLAGLRLPNAMFDDAIYVMAIDNFVQEIVSKTRNKKEFIATLNLFGMQIQRECGFQIYPDDTNANGDTLQ